MYARIRQDLYGCIDIAAIHPERKGVLGIQCTSDANVSARVSKIQDIPAAKIWIQAGNSLWVVGWGKHGPRGKAKHWRMRTVSILGWQDGKIVTEVLGEEAQHA
jgi:hypothetical protein